MKIGILLCLAFQRYASVGIRQTTTLQFIYDSIRCNELSRFWILSETGQRSWCEMRFWNWCFFFFFNRWQNGWQENEIDFKRLGNREEQWRGKKKTQKDSQSIYFHRFSLPKCVFITHSEIYFQRNWRRRRRRSWLSHSASVQFALLSISTDCLTKTKTRHTQPLKTLFAEKSISGN